MILYSLSGLLCCLYVNLGGSARLRTVVVPLQKTQLHRTEYLCLFILSQVLFCTLDCQLLVAFNSTNNDFTTLHKHCLIFLQLFILCEENMEHSKRMFTRSRAHKLNISKLLHKFDNIISWWTVKIENTVNTLHTVFDCWRHAFVYLSYINHYCYAYMPNIPHYSHHLSWKMYYSAWRFLSRRLSV